MTHGYQPHVARGVCTRKLAFTTWDAAMGKLTQVPGAVRVIRGSCCGWYHITSMTEAEFAQAVADSGCTDAYNRGMMDLSTEEYLKRWDQTHEAEAGEGREPRAREGDAGEASQPRCGSTRLAPSPAALAQRLQARSDSGW
jgi:hypothetical protein